VNNSPGVEVLTAVATMNSIFWDIPSCSPVKVNRHFGGTYRLSLQCGKVSGALLAACLMLVFFGWMDGVEKDLRNLYVVNWKTKALEQDGWRKFLEQAKTHKGL
jgi:hypothetical protein